MRNGVTEASGFLGSALVPDLRAAGYDVVHIGRGSGADIPWNPADGTIFPVPAFALKSIYGEMAEGTLVVSQRVAPRRLLEAGYTFRHPSLELALRAAVGA